MKINVRSLLMLVSFAAALLMVLSCAQQPIVAAAVQAQETAQVPVATVGGGDGSRRVEALVRQPSAGSGQTKYPAVILLHSAWGWADPHEGVQVYAEALSGAGYVTLEPRMFPGGAGTGLLRPICPNFSACSGMQRRVQMWTQTASPFQASPSAASCHSSQPQNGLTSHT